jgi:hypothetical protein
MDTAYKIDFSQWQQDFQALAYRRLLGEFKNSPVLKQLINAFGACWQELADTVIELMRNRMIYDANNYYLDAIGRIVGQPWQDIATDLSLYFRPDNDAVAPDIGLAYVTGGVGETGARIDSIYKIEVLGRIFSNMTRYSSIPEIQAACLALFGFDISFQNVISEPCAVDIYVSRVLTDFELGFLVMVHQQPSVQNSYFIAYPATLRINSINITGGAQLWP